MMPSQDYMNSWWRHNAAVAELVRLFREAGLREHGGPPFTFAVAPRRSIIPKAGIVPRDLVARLDGETFSVKVYWTDDVTHSSLFRPVAYAIMHQPGEPYIQLVLGGRDIPIPWLVDMQPPLDLATASGINGMDAFVTAVKAVVSQQSETH